MLHSSDKCKGFSLIELIAVVLLLGILAVVAIGRLGNQDGLLARGYFDEFAAAVQFARKLAISSGCDVRVEVLSTGYALRQSSTCTADDFTDAVPNPADRTQNYANNDIPGGFTLAPAPGQVTFDARGLPTPEFNGSTDFTLSGGATTYTIRVYGRTGLVDVL